jgi:AI-2 transport protein TqsA
VIEMPDTAAATVHVDRTRNRLLAAVAAVLMLFALRATQSVTMPLALGLSFAVLVWPLQRWVERRTARWVGLLAAILALVLAIGAIFALLGWSANALVDRSRQYQPRITVLRQQAAALGARFGIEVPGARSDAPDGAREIEGAAKQDTGQSGFAQRVGAALYESLADLGLALGFAALALAEVHAVRKRIRSRLAPDTAEKLLSVATEVTDAVRRYFVVKSATSAITGVATALFTFAVGLDLAAVWGMLAFLLEYVPSIGSLIAVIPPSIFALLQFEGFTKPLLVAGGLGALQLVLGNFVDPKIEGSYMSVSPLVVLFSIVFWAWVWGPFGALLGVPLTVALTIVAKHFEGTRWAWALLTERERGERRADA